MSHMIHRATWTATGWPTGAAPLRMTMAGGSLAALFDDGSVLAWPSVDEPCAAVAVTRILGWAARQAHLSPSGRYLLCRGTGHTAVYDLSTAGVCHLAIRDEAYALPAAMHRRDVVLVLDQRCAALTCDDGSELFNLDRGVRLKVHRTIALPGGNTVAMVTFQQNEPEDHLQLLSLDQAMRASHLEEAVHEIDVAYSVSAGPDGSDRFLCYRSPGAQVDEDEDESPVPADLRKLRGFYGVRFADGAAVERIPSMVPGTSSSEVVGAEGWIFVRDENKLFVVDRTTGDFDVEHGASIALDAERRRAAVASPDGVIALMRSDNS